MRKVLLLAALSLTALASTVSARSTLSSRGNYPCPQCTTYADGSQCCVSCMCNGAGVAFVCTDNYCPPPDDGTHD